MELVSINRIYVARSLLFALLLLWPLLLFGRPAYMPDSAAYQNGGEHAVSFVLQKLHLQAPSRQPSSEAQLAAASDESETKVARSIPYSVLGYVLSGPNLTMGYMAVFHALAMALVMTALFEAIAGAAWRGYTIMVGITTFTTGLAPIVGFIVPDCFTAIMLAIMMVLPFYWARFSWPMRVFLCAMGVFSVAVHASHPPVAVGTAIVASMGVLLMRGSRKESRGIAMPVLWVPALLGLLVIIGTGLVGFGKVSIAPKHYPLALARGIENGPARWYLEKACRDRKAYAVCEIYGTHIPTRVVDILWAENNIVQRASAEQLDRVRAEENTILLRATLAYPTQQAYFILRDVPMQFISFCLDYLSYDNRIIRNDAGDITLDNPAMGAVPSLLVWLDGITKISVLSGAALLAWRWRAMTLAERTALLTLLTGLLVNAAVCAIFSGVTTRYQARIIWLVPYLAVAIECAWRAREGIRTDR